MKVRLVFQFGKGRLEAGAADKRHVRSKALFDIEALLREQPRQVRIDFEERVIRLDFAANQVRAAQPCGRAGRKRRSRVVCRDLPKYLAQNICFYFIHVAHESRRYVQIFFRGDLASRKLFPQGERSFVKPIRNLFLQQKCVKNPHISISV